ncbi:MAG: hypothetical protein KDE22_02750 [Rhodobacterales bacterium]|nr:hypothetical protein [Rhodobacterales bacterium]
MTPKQPQGTHEDLHRHDDVKVGSERAFGLVFAAVFTIIALVPLIKGADPRWWSLAVAAVFGVLAFVAPKVLRPLNLVWFKFGLLLHKIVSPLIMGLLFFVTVTPMALLLRLLGKDPLHRSFDPKADSYWIRRDPPGPAPETMKNQF